MKPFPHLVFGCVVTLGFFALFMPDQITLPVIFLSLLGFLPDFDHRKWIWKLVALGVFAAFFFFFLSSFETTFQDNQFVAFAASLAASALIAGVLYAWEPFHMEYGALGPKQKAFHGSGTVFLVAYVLIIFLATGSFVYALAALLCFASHWVLDYVTYETKTGRHYLAGPRYADQWWMPYEWHIAKNKAKEAREAQAKAREAQAKAAQAKAKTLGAKEKKK